VSEWTAGVCSFAFADRVLGVHAFAMSTTTDAIAKAERAGFDLSLVAHSLTLTPTERAQEHDGALALVLGLERIRDEEFPLIDQSLRVIAVPLGNEDR
jgi:hypothetical protein